MRTRSKAVIVVILVLLALILFGLWRKRVVANEENPPIEEPIKVAVKEPTKDMTSWKEFRAINGKFKALLPSLPQHVAEAVPLSSGQGLVRYDMYLAQEKGGDTVMISLIQYPKEFDVTHVDDLLDGVMKEMMSGNGNNQLKNMTKGQYQKCPSLDFSIENNDVFIRCRAFVVGKTLYVITLISRNSESLEAFFKKFIDSFTVGEIEAQEKETQEKQKQAVSQ